MITRRGLHGLVSLLGLLVSGCTGDGGIPGAGPEDLRPPRPTDFQFGPDPDLPFDEPDLADPPPCFEGMAGCHHVHYGPPNDPFPLQSNIPADNLERDRGVGVDLNGYLKLDSTHTSFVYLWIPNTHDLNDAGTVSKLDSKTIRETARYLTVTCNSLKTGSRAACDGTSGCCTADDDARYQARKNKLPEPGHQAVQTQVNLPSRTSVDFNGDLFIANEAFGGQSSVTRIANDPSSCIDYNKSGRIDSSQDTNGNGWIETDCNGDGQLDDLASVQAKPCLNGLRQEFYGLDDECILWTSNVFPAQARVRALGLGSGDTSVSDAWAGSYANGSFVRLNGVTGKAAADVLLPIDCLGGGSGPNGVAIDASGIGWVPQRGAGKLCYFDTRKVGNTGVVRDPPWGLMQADGITMDRDQNVWVGQEVARYTPDRTNGFNNLGGGWWTRFPGVTGTRIAADSRSVNAYFVYSCTAGGVLQIPASTFKVMKMDQSFTNPGWPAIHMPCLGVAVDSDQNVWGIDAQTSTRALVDKNGVITQPTVNGPPMGANKCPAGDSCANRGADQYSDIAMFGLRGISRPTGTYQLLIPGCTDANGRPADTEWRQVAWDCDIPPNTSLTLHAKSADAVDITDPSWAVAPWTADQVDSPLSLADSLTPNWTPGSPPGARDGALVVEFTFKTAALNATPRLRSFDVWWSCPR